MIAAPCIIEVGFPLNLLKTASVNVAVSMLVRSIHNTGRPKLYIPTSVAGKSATITSHIVFVFELAEKTCGDDSTIRLSTLILNYTHPDILSFSYLLRPYSLPALSNVTEGYDLDN